MNVFDRQAKRMQRNRAAAAQNAHIFNYLKDEVIFIFKAYKCFNRVYK